MFQQLIENMGTFDVKYVWYIILFPFIAFWVRTVLYTTKDISHRTDSVWYQLFSILLVFLWTPLIWYPLYLIFRPMRYQDEVNLIKTVRNLSIECLDCEHLNYKDNNFCVNCWVWLKIECKECKKQYYSWYDYCPFCGAPNLEIE